MEEEESPFVTVFPVGLPFFNYPSIKEFIDKNRFLLMSQAGNKPLEQVCFGWYMLGQVWLAAIEEPSTEDIVFTLAHEYLHHILENMFDVEVSFQFDIWRKNNPKITQII